MNTPRSERFAIAVVVGGTAAIVAYVGLRGLRLPTLPAAATVALLGIGFVFWFAKRLPAELDGVWKRKPLWSTAWLLLGFLAIGQTVRLSSFVLDPSQSQLSLFPNDAWYVEHSCLTAYAESARLNHQGEPNIYEPAHYIDRKVGPFRVDVYLYPPPFLLLPLAAQAVTGGEYERVRSLWFAVSGLVLILAMGLLASQLEPEAQQRALAVAPAIWLSIPVQLGLQMSNYQILAVSLAVLGFVAFLRRPVLGGALLAVSVVTKVFPGILVAYLLARRRWRDAAWTAAFAVAFCLIALAVLGQAPFRAFVDFELPRLSSGEAFARPFSRPFAVARNMAPFGIPLKLAQLEVPSMTLAVGRVIGTIYGLGLVCLLVWAARYRPRSNAQAASIWLALLSLATLASPFAPASYVLVTLVWLACLDRTLGRPWLAVTVWLLTTAPFLFPREGPILQGLLTHLPAQVLAITLPAIVLIRAGARRVDDPIPESAGFVLAGEEA